MPLQHGQVQIRNLVMGPGTDFIVESFDPWQLQVRADQSGPRAWNHGSWSGAEWAEERIVPIEFTASAYAAPAWLGLHQQAAAAFAPVGDSGQDVELRWCVGEDEFALFGRPRMAVADSRVIGQGVARTSAAFVATDPRIYSGTLHEESTTLPVQTGGLTVPLQVPFTIPGELLAGRLEITNAGTTETGMLWRIDGPAAEPRVTVRSPTGEVQTWRYLDDVPAGQWLIVDTAARTVFANGLPDASRRGRVVGDFPLLSSGESVIRFGSGVYSNQALLTVQWRDAWW